MWKFVTWWGDLQPFQAGGGIAFYSGLHQLFLVFVCAFILMLKWPGYFREGVFQQYLCFIDSSLA